MAHAKARPLFDAEIVIPAIMESFKKLHPIHLWKNPVIFVTEIGAVITTLELIFNRGGGSVGFVFQICLWLWFTVLFANFAEAMAEGRGKAHADTLRRSRKAATAHKLLPDGTLTTVPAESLRKGDVFVVAAREVIAADGEVIEGAASIDEAAITGESAPVIRESGGDRSAVTGGTTVLSDEIKVRVTADPGESFMDHMISLIEGAKRQRTPNEIALSILLSALTIVFMVVCVTLKPFAIYTSGYAGETLNQAVTVAVLISLLVCLIPTTIGGLLSAIGIAGIDRMVQKNVLAMSGRAVEAAGDVDVLLLDKTGTITVGNRHATKFVPVGGYTDTELAQVAALASAADETPEGRSIVKLAQEFNGAVGALSVPPGSAVISFSAQTRMSGIDVPGGQSIRKGAPDAVLQFVKEHKGQITPPVEATLQEMVEGAASKGATPLLVAEGNQIAGMVVLEDVLKPEIKVRFERFRAMGIRTVMITGDNPLTAAAIAAQAGVDDYLAQARPEDKMALIRQEQANGHLVAMTGDGTNDAPALAQADVGMAMQTGTQAAKEAGNMVDLDSNPTKLIEVVEIGKQLLMTRGALTTFSIANDVAKYFAIIPALLVVAFPQIAPLNVMHLGSPASAILSAVIFNAVIIIALVPLALRGVKFRAMNTAVILRRNLLIYGLGGLVVPFISIKLINLVIYNLLHLA
jgi:K+-transporting ATPase ATPase B chain